MRQEQRENERAREPTASGTWGLSDGQEPEKLSYWTFCRLCNCKAEAGSPVYVDRDSKGKQYVIHERCPWMKDQPLTKGVFLEDVKTRPRSRQTRTNTKRQHQGDGNGYCNFCHLLTGIGEQYVKDGRYRRYHVECWARVKKVQERTRNSLR